MKKLNSRKENGAFAIDAVLGLTFFMIAILALMFMSLIIKVQSSMQYALGQTAKEISGYFYLMDKFGLASIISGEPNPAAKENVAQLNSTIGSIVEFTGNVKNETDKIDMGADLLTNINNLKDTTDFNALQASAQTMASELKACTENGSAIDQLKAVLQIFGTSLINRGFSVVAAPLVCNALMPKYLASDIDKYYEKTGIDPDSISFTGSQMLMDGRSIKLVVQYELDAERLTLGMVKGTLTFRQTATTAAWISPDSSKKKELWAIKLPEPEESAAESPEESETSADES